MPKPGTTTMRGYGYSHRRIRAAIAKTVDAGHATCTRCSQQILPGSRWDLDHSDDRRGYLGVAHARCNRAAGAEKGNSRRRRRKATALRW